MAEYDARADAALARLVLTLPTNAAQLLLAQHEEALAERELLWRQCALGNRGRHARLAFSIFQARS